MRLSDLLLLLLGIVGWNLWEKIAIKVNWILLLTCQNFLKNHFWQLFSTYAFFFFISMPFTYSVGLRSPCFPWPGGAITSSSHNQFYYCQPTGLWQLCFSYHVSVPNMIRKLVKSKHIMPKIKENSLQERPRAVQYLRGVTPFYKPRRLLFGPGACILKNWGTQISYMLK